MKRHENNIRDIWDNVKQANLHIIGIPEGEEKEKGDRKYIWKSYGWKLSKSKGNRYKIQETEVPTVAQQKQIWLVSIRMRVQSLLSLSGLGIWCCCELWCRSETAWIPHCCGCGTGQQLYLRFDPSDLTWELPWATNAALKKTTTKKMNLEGVIYVLT